jgi:hydroxylamine reductase (hybrid-cluster protein)
MSSNIIGELAGNMGTFVVNTTTEVTKYVDAIVVLEETIFTSIKVNGVDAKNTYIQDATLAVKAGAIITPINDLQFSGLQLSSGSVALVLG